MNSRLDISKCTQDDDLCVSCTHFAEFMDSARMKPTVEERDRIPQRWCRALNSRPSKVCACSLYTAEGSCKEELKLLQEDSQEVQL